MGIGDWGLGIGDWGLGIGANPHSPIPNPQSPIPNPQSPIPILIIIYILLIIQILNFKEIILKNIYLNKMSEETLEQYFHRFSHDINCLNDPVKYFYNKNFLN